MTHELACEREARPLLYAVYAFALWTICSHLTVLRGGTLDDLFLTFSILGILVGGIAIAVRRQGDQRSRGQDQPETPSRHVSPPSGDIETACLAPKWEPRLFMVCLVAVAVLTSIAHRPDIDDASYLNLAVSVVDDPALPIMTFDRQHDLPYDLQIRTSLRLRSFEMLSAAYARLTGRPAIEMAHLIIPPLAAIACLLAYRFLFRLLLPTVWLQAVLATLGFLLSDGATHTSYGNFSFVRLHQGKGLLVSIAVPLLIAGALAFGNQPSRRRWWRLAIVQIAALGLSSSALLVAPVVVVLAVIAGSPRCTWTWPPRALGRTTAQGALTSFYLVIAAVIARFPVIHALTATGSKAFGESLEPATPWLEMVLSDQLSIKFFRLLVIFATPLFLREGMARRLSSAIAILMASLLVMDWIPASLSRYWLSPTVLWRILWILPAPVLVTLFVLSPVTRFRRTRRSWGFSLLLALLVVGPFSGGWILSRANNVRIGWPGLKTTDDYQIARLAVEHLDERLVILAPDEVSAWLPTFQGHPYPLLSRRSYATATRFRSELKQRKRLKRLIQQPESRKYSAQAFTRLLDLFEVRAVILTGSPGHDRHRRAIEQLGFDLLLDEGDWQIWLR